jgi:hypothetical protein
MKCRRSVSIQSGVSGVPERYISFVAWNGLVIVLMHLCSQLLQQCCKRNAVCLRYDGTTRLVAGRGVFRARVTMPPPVASLADCTPGHCFPPPPSPGTT